MGFLPDTRHGFQIAGNALWYRYATIANPTANPPVRAQFGLARVRLTGGTPQAVITIDRDTFQNEASFDFVIDGNTIYGSHTNIERIGTTLQSRLLVYRRSMPSPL